MKKYYSLSAASLSLTALALLAGCQDYDGLMSEEQMESIAAAKKKVTEFNNAFVERFGEPAKDHDWGMKLLEPMDLSGSALTRATNNNVRTDRNNWCMRNNSGYRTDQPQLTLIDKIRVPGWPNFDGYYYANRGSSTLDKTLSGTEIFTNEYLNWQPSGDVTDYEVNYVSTWFRTHKNPKSEPLHLTDFFVQNISQDNDQLWYHDAIDLGGNSMQQGLPAGYPKTGGQTGPDGQPRSEWWNGDDATYANDVVDNNNDRRSGIGADIQVSKKSGHYNSNERLNFAVDYLHFKSTSGNAFTETGFNPGDGWTHINNFNYQNSNLNPEQAVNKHFREIKYVHSSGTEDFACRSSMANQNSWIHDWVLVHLTWSEPGADGVVREREGFYLGFDFSGETNDTQIQRDGFYSNWIIKISPAYFSKSDKVARVMCEDLGGLYDFDFNDVVFDVALDESQAVICLLASGGTLPIAVGSTDYEAHKMLGQDNTSIPMNVDAPKGGKHEVAIYRVDANAYLTGGKLDFYKIPIQVKYDKNGEWTNVNHMDNIGNSDWTEEQYGSAHSSVQSGEKKPRKFATEVGVRWMKEEKWIDNGYEKFKEWVKNKDYVWHMTAEASIDKYWYEDQTNINLMYQGSEVAPDNTATVTHPIQPWQNLKTIKVTDEFQLKDKAVDYVTIASYPTSEQNPIKAQLEDKSMNSPVTFAYITKAPKATGETGVHGMIIPIWIIEDSQDSNKKKPYWVKPDGTKTEITTAILDEVNSYRVALWQENFNLCGVGGATQSNSSEQGVDANGDYTYVTKYGYLKSDLYVKPKGESEARYCDYVAFYVKEDVADNPYSTADVVDNQGVMNSDGVVKKYECYVIF